MNKTAIIIPSRLNAQRFPNKPLKLIKNKEMILPFMMQQKNQNQAKCIASPDEEIIEKVKKYGERQFKHLMLTRQEQIEF